MDISSVAQLPDFKVAGVPSGISPSFKDRIREERAKLMNPSSLSEKEKLLNSSHIRKKQGMI